MKRNHRRHPRITANNERREPNPVGVPLRLVKCRNCVRPMFCVPTEAKLYMTSVYCPLCLNRMTVNLYPIGFEAEERREDNALHMGIPQHH